MTRSGGPLAGLTVVDFSQIRAGPWCTQLLGEMGAEVLKVERPGSGARERSSEPRRRGFSADHLARNRNKRSVAIDVKTDEGLALARELVADADVLVENFGPGTMERLGLGYDDVADENPGLVYASIKAYGEGPQSERKGVDLIVQAEGGIMSVTGPEGGPPVKLGQALGDIGTGLYATIGVLAALYERDAGGSGGGGSGGDGSAGNGDDHATGQPREEATGQKVSTDLFGTIVSFMEEYLTIYGMTGEDPEPLGRRHQTVVPYEVAETADGHVAFVVMGGEGEWETFATEVLEAEELLEFDSQAERLERYDEIAEVMHPILRGKTTAEWREIFDSYGYPNGPVNRVSDVVGHPQALAQGAVEEHTHDEAGDVLLHGHPLRFSDAETGTRRDAPSLGADTDAVLAERLGLDDDEIATLRDGGAIE